MYSNIASKRSNKPKNYDPGGDIDEQKLSEDKFYKFRSKDTESKYKYNKYNNYF